MALIKDPSRLNKRAAFGTVQSVELPSGISKPQFVSLMTVWCAIWVRSLSQQYQLIGTNLEDTQTIVIRHNPGIDDSMKVQIDDNTYTIVSINPDESTSIITYDTVTIRKVS